jgi:diguanylate cyclase (GGDEF)-like protein
MGAVFKDLSLRTRVILIVLALVVMAGVWALDFYTGYEISFSIFYLIPIVLTTWYVGREAGIVMALLCAAAWLLADLGAGQHYSHRIIPFWNAGVRLGFFLVTVLTLAPLKRTLHSERTFARTDFLTGIANMKAFFEMAEFEIARSRRSDKPLSIVYLDCDNFKTVNDQFGHTAGDALLRAIAEALKSSIRPTDTVARAGGDEFVVLLPETNEPAAGIVIARLQANLNAAMKKRRWPVTFSIGAVTFTTPFDSVDKMIKKADNLMYQVKGSGKNDFRQETCDG